MIKSFAKILFLFFTISSSITNYGCPMLESNFNNNNDCELILQDKKTKKEIGWITYKICPFDHEKGIICHVFVEEECRKRGLEKNLVMQACQNLSSKGCNIVELEISQENCTARSFFEKLGFEELSIDDDFDTVSIFETVFIFRKKLIPIPPVAGNI